jgi:hypothetical protein
VVLTRTTRRVYDDHAVHGLGDLGQNVARNQDGSALPGQPPDQPAEPPDTLRVESVGRLVQDQHFGVAEHGGGYREPLAHAKGELANPPCRVGLELDKPQRLLHPGRVDTARHRLDAEVVAGPPTRIEARCFQHGADLTKRIGQVGVCRPIDGGGAVGRSHQAKQCPEGGGFPGAVWPEEPDGRAPVNLKAQPVDREHRTEPLGQPPYLDRCHGTVLSFCWRAVRSCVRT